MTEVAKDKAIADGEDGSNVIVQTIDCHNHLRNVCIGAITKRMSSYLNKILACNLDAINFRYRVSNMIDAVLRAVDKEFSLPDNYRKGHDDEFKNWLNLNHPGAFLVPIARTSGSRQDLDVEGATAVYWNCKYYVEFMDEQLKAARDNILQENIFIVLTSVEMIDLCRLFAIFHFTVCMPMRFLVGKTHHIGAVGYNW